MFSLIVEPWGIWVAGVLPGINAPINSTTVDAFWGWSNAETFPYALMRWNNPLNSTLKWYVNGVRVSSDSGAQPGNNDVQIYPSIDIGIAATIATLTNGFYPTICTNVQNSIPRSSWSNACSELIKWGTGCGWLNTNYGSFPSDIIPLAPLLPKILGEIIVSTIHGAVQFGRGQLDVTGKRGLFFCIEDPNLDDFGPWVQIDPGGNLGTDDLGVEVIRFDVTSKGTWIITVDGTDDKLYRTKSTNNGATWTPFTGPFGSVDGLTSSSAVNSVSSPSVDLTPVENALAQLQTEVLAIPTNDSPVDFTAVLNAIAAVKGELDTVKAKTDKDLA